MGAVMAGGSGRGQARQDRRRQDRLPERSSPASCDYGGQYSLEAAARSAYSRISAARLLGQKVELITADPPRTSRISRGLHQHERAGSDPQRARRHDVTRARRSRSVALAVQELSTIRTKHRHIVRWVCADPRASRRRLHALRLHRLSFEPMALAVARRRSWWTSGRAGYLALLNRRLCVRLPARKEQQRHRQGQGPAAGRRPVRHKH